MYSQRDMFLEIFREVMEPRLAAVERKLEALD
jgi:hypothetical protein